MDRALVLQALVDADRNLRRQTIVCGIDGRTDHCRELRVDKDLTANDGEHPRSFWITGRRMADPNRARRASRDDLVGQDVLGLFVETLGSTIEDIEVSSVPRAVAAEKGTDRRLDKGRSASAPAG